MVFAIVQLPAAAATVVATTTTTTWFAQRNAPNKRARRGQGKAVEGKIMLHCYADRRRIGFQNFTPMVANARGPSTPGVSCLERPRYIGSISSKGQTG